MNERALTKRGAQHEDTSEDDTEHPPAAHPDAYLPSYPDMQGAYRGPDSAYPAAAPGYPPAAPSYTATPATPYPTAASPYPIAQPPYSESMAPAYPGAAPVQPYDQRYPAAANQLGYTSPGARTGDTHGTSVYGAPAQWHQNPYASAHGNVGALVPPLTQRERDFLPIFLSEGALGVTDISKLTGVAPSSTYVTLSKLEQAGLIEKTVGQKRILTDLGYQVANSL